MTFTNIGNNIDEAVNSLQRLDVDDQLAVLWFIYTDMKDGLNPSPTAGLEISQAIVDQIQHMSREEQLQVQRDIIQGAGNDITREYQAMHSRVKLGVWYLLAQGMEQETIVPMPPDYELSSESQELLNALKGLDFEQKTNFMISAVSKMGS
jgi:Orange carotenoid protein, N-terminal